jgi:hypothetical protein
MKTAISKTEYICQALKIDQSSKCLVGLLGPLSFEPRTAIEIIFDVYKDSINVLPLDRICENYEKHIRQLRESLYELGKESFQKRDSEFSGEYLEIENRKHRIQQYDAKDLTDAITYLLRPVLPKIYDPEGSERLSEDDPRGIMTNTEANLRAYGSYNNAPGEIVIPYARWSVHVQFDEKKDFPFY